MAKKVLVVVDMQNDFITGSLGTPEAQAIVPRVVEKIQGFGGTVLYTQDTHGADYLQTLDLGPAGQAGADIVGTVLVPLGQQVILVRCV